MLLYMRKPEVPLSLDRAAARLRRNSGTRPTGRSHNERGGTTVEVLMAMMSVLVITIFMFNAILMLYARSVTQHAADVGARSAARSGGTEAMCEAVAADTIKTLAALYADDTSIQCSKGTTATSATVLADLGPAFGDLGPRWRFTIRSTVVTEPVP